MHAFLSALFRAAATAMFGAASSGDATSSRDDRDSSSSEERLPLLELPRNALEHIASHLVPLTHYAAFACVSRTCRAAAADAEAQAISGEVAYRLLVGDMVPQLMSRRQPRLLVPAGRGVTTVHYAAFADLYRTLIHVSLPVSVVTIDRMAFCDCFALTSVELPEGLTTLGKRAFAGCAALASINMPASLTALGQLCFADCSSLTTVDLSDCHIPVIPDNVFFACRGLTSVSLPARLETIEACAFEECVRLTSVVFPPNHRVTSIHKQALQLCPLVDAASTARIAAINWECEIVLRQTKARHAPDPSQLAREEARRVADHAAAREEEARRHAAQVAQDAREEEAQACRRRELRRMVAAGELARENIYD